MRLPELTTRLRTFELDVRAIGVFRIAPGIIVLTDQLL